MSGIVIKKLARQAHKLHTVAASNNRDHPTRSLYHCLFTSHRLVCCSLRTSHSWWIALSMQHRLRGCNNIPSFSLWTPPIAHSFCEGCTRHHFHILVKAPLFCDWKSQVASMLRFTLWQQATIEIPRRARSISACLRRIYVGVVLHVHPVRGESHIQHNTNRVVATLAAKLG